MSEDIRKLCLIALELRGPGDQVVSFGKAFRPVGCTDVVRDSLGVPPGLIMEKGAVSSEVAAAMARGNKADRGS